MSMPSAESRARREAAVRAHWDAENRHDVDGVVGSFSDKDARYDIPAFGPDGQVPDAASMKDFWVEMFATFPDFNVEPGEMLHGENHIFVEVRVTGTHEGEFVGIPPTGRRVDLHRVANLFEFEGDEIVCERVYLDLNDMLRQLQPGEGE